MWVRQRRELTIIAAILAVAGLGAPPGRAARPRDRAAANLTCNG